MNSSEHLLQKKFNITNNTSNYILNDPIILETKKIIDNQKETVSINSKLYNSKIKNFYTKQTIKNNAIYTNGLTFPLMLYNSRYGCDLIHLKNIYSISKINLYLEYLQNDEYEKVYNVLTTEETQEILYNLYYTKQNIDVCYHNLLNTYEEIFRSIRLFYFIYTDINSKTLNCDKFQEDSEILNNITRLKEYLNELKIDIHNFINMSIKADSLNIKDEYKEYINLYGVPYKCMFDEILLQEIKYKYQNNK